jgi:Spy/CpxP family protein refolding chaperone
MAQRRARVGDSARVAKGPVADSLRKLRAAGVDIDSLRKARALALGADTARRGRGGIAGDSLRKLRAAGVDLDSLRRARGGAAGAALARPTERGIGAAGILSGITLTAEQQKEIEAIRAKYQKEQNEALRGGKAASANGAKKPAKAARDTSAKRPGRPAAASGQTALDRMEDLARRQTAEIRAVLTAEQQKQFDANVARVKGRGGDARKGRGPGR